MSEGAFDEEDDIYDGDLLDEDADEECGAYGDGPAVRQWQRCQLAGTEHCDWECSFSRHVLLTLAEQKQVRRAIRRSKKAADMFTPAGTPPGESR